MQAWVTGAHDRPTLRWRLPWSASRAEPLVLSLALHFVNSARNQFAHWQAAVAAALALVEANALRAGGAGADDGPARALEFASERLADGRATAPPAGLLRVLAYVALGPWPVRCLPIPFFGC